MGDPRGYLVDYLTQLWVCLTGRRLMGDDCDWLRGPVGAPYGIGPDYFQELSMRHGWLVRDGLGLLSDARYLARSGNELDAEIRAFYERTAEYEMDVWSEWNTALRPFGWLLTTIFGRRLDQLNVPLSALEMRDGLTSRILNVLGPDGTVRYVAWLRTIRSTGRVLYAGSYSLCTVPGHDGYCLKVVFPLPNGSATVILWPQVDSSGSLHLYSHGNRFGDAGFYVIVQHGEQRWARYVSAMREHIHVYQNNGTLLTDHTLRIFGVTFLRLHYRITHRGIVDPSPKAATLGL